MDTSDGPVGVCSRQVLLYYIGLIFNTFYDYNKTKINFKFERIFIICRW